MSYLEVTWTDDETGINGYVVIDRLSRGLSGGGLRMRKGVTIDEVRDLARGMSLKEPVVYTPGDKYIPLGGAKAGIDCDPYDPRSREVLGRFARAIKPLIDTCFATGEDFGVRQDTIDEVFAAEGIASSAGVGYRVVEDGPQAGIDRQTAAFAVDVDGVGLGELVGGYGVATTALAAMKYRGLEPATTRAVVQGFGSMGGATARYLAKAGVKVVGIADRDGLVYNADGLDVETLLLTRDAFGVIDRTKLRANDEQRDGADWLALDAEVLIPAAMSYVITDDNVDRIQATIIAEAANVATLKDAEASLYRRGVTVVPDFVANVGTNAWWWWVVFGDIEPTAEASFAKLSDVLGPLTLQVLDRAAADGVQPREAATRISDEKRAIADSMYPRTIKHEPFTN